MTPKVWLIYLGPLLAFIATSATGILPKKVTIFVKTGLTYGELFILLYITILLIGMITDKLNTEIKNKDQLIAHYEEDIKNKTAGLLDHYKRLNRFQLKEVMHDVMRAFTEKHAYVISTQLYKYNIQHTIVQKTETTIIKVNYVQGFIDEREEQNSMLQTYYYIPTSLFFNYYDALFYLAKDKMPMFEFIIQLVDTLNDEVTYKEQVSDLHAIKFSFIILGLEALGLEENNKILQNHEVEAIIRKRMKTGIMRGILNKAEFFTFNYIPTKFGDISDKDGRIYLTQKIKVRGESHIFLITISKFIHETDEPALNIKGIGEEFRQLLIDSIPGSEYN
ncbi:hypothetical protein [Massilibacterium senegalense]|uniref:hypothetical protein n=1 Tax=Massilibacterium senegalense TaxID=1632858 RepID=UPI00078286F6|nr:hypothetical protein [Massilibacterium senegalense]